MGFRVSNASGGRIVLLPGAFWAHGASKTAILGASLLLCILQCFGASEGMLPPGACRSSRASARRIVSCRALCASSLCPQIPHAPAPTFGVFRSFSPRPEFRPEQKAQTSPCAFSSFSPALERKKGNNKMYSKIISSIVKHGHEIKKTQIRGRFCVFF